MRMIYLDNNATTQPAPAVVDAMCDALREYWGNPSSIHRFGQVVRQKVDLARESVAKLIGCSDREVCFTSGGTESVNLAIRGSLEAQPRRRVVATTRIEHSAGREQAQHLSDCGVEVVWLGMDANGVVDVGAVNELLQRRADALALVSVMWANNETGVIQPIEQIGATCREHGVRFHTDGTQWVGKMPTDVAAMPIDLMTFAAHKFHGPKGVGGLYMRRGVRVCRQTHGGPQERERRGGTENVPGIVGLGVAEELAREWLAGDGLEKQRALRDDFERRVLGSIEDAVVNCADAPRVWNTANIAFPKLEAEAILLLLSERGVCASAGSACSSGSLEPSPVLLSLGIPPEHAHGSVRFSICRDTMREEVEDAAGIITDVIAKLRTSMLPV